MLGVLKMKRRIPGLFNAGSGINPWGVIAIVLCLLIIAVFAFGGLGFIIFGLVILAATGIESGYDGTRAPLDATTRNIILGLVGVGLFYIGVSMWSLIWGIRIVGKGSMGLIRATILIVITIPPAYSLYVMAPSMTLWIVSSIF